MPGQAGCHENLERLHRPGGEINMMPPIQTTLAKLLTEKALMLVNQEKGITQTGARAAAEAIIGGLQVMLRLDVEGLRKRLKSSISPGLACLIIRTMHNSPTSNSNHFVQRYAGPPDSPDTRSRTISTGSIATNPPSPADPSYSDQGFYPMQQYYYPSPMPQIINEIPLEENQSSGLICEVMSLSDWAPAPYCNDASQPPAQHKTSSETGLVMNGCGASTGSKDYHEGENKSGESTGSDCRTRSENRMDNTITEDKAGLDSLAEYNNKTLLEPLNDTPRSDSAKPNDGEDLSSNEFEPVITGELMLLSL
ncbi:hypothetical protein PPACK8108_LOCUS21876 [Phakopsora pachyrhizi]|uniref:Uncharacterized protein n=1 Tax=Phakopsora pachyrhizi TaxID=170000 RepID=A0AAV0BLW7_PHAPC|nr:hypothetical protein PPACK8108_LOCUS21876 [Phakopsora pachyrhizi]